MLLHECFHVPVTSCQRAEVKRVLHCDATTSVDMDALLSETFPAVAIFSPQQIQISYLDYPLFIFIEKVENLYKIFNVES